MPWIIERDGSSLRVHVACPIDDWDVLLEEAQRRLEIEEGLTVIVMPTKIAGASQVDAEVLQLLRRVLGHTSGLPLHEPEASTRP
jgi:hypothetical protein